MCIADAIISARYCGILHCGISSLDQPSIAELAVEFGLAGNGAYTEISIDAARHLIRLILNRQMAYDTRIVPERRAAALADLFLGQFGDSKDVKFFTNCTCDETRGAVLSWRDVSWNPVTSGVFDAGVLILGPQHSGCLWGEDTD